MHATAQSPGSITGFFVIYPKGSTGACLNIADAMKTKVSNARKDTFTMNGKSAKLPVSRKVLELFREKTQKQGAVKIEHKTKFPIGYGLGVSGAGALSLSIALNKLFKTKLSKPQILEIAKEAEIFCGTGLGDVVAEQFAGLLMGKPPYPSTSGERIKCAEKYVALGFFRPIETKKIIRSSAWKKKINKSGLACMHGINSQKSMKSFMELSRKFTRESGLGTRQILDAMDRLGSGSMSMLGETIFIPTNSPKKWEKELKKYCRKTIIARIAQKGAALL